MAPVKPNSKGSVSPSGPGARPGSLPQQPFCPAREKAQELSDWIHQLESEKFDLMAKLKQQKYEVRPVFAGGQAGLGLGLGARLGLGRGRGRVGAGGASPSSSANTFLWSPQINVLYNRISHAQKL